MLGLASAAARNSCPSQAPALCWQGCCACSPLLLPFALGAVTRRNDGPEKVTKTQRDQHFDFFHGVSGRYPGTRVQALVQWKESQKNQLCTPL
eukprot:1338670-Rhodomonas_salina.1